jgi:hypothetical protein
MLRLKGVIRLLGDLGGLRFKISEDRDLGLLNGGFGGSDTLVVSGVSWLNTIFVLAGQIGGFYLCLTKSIGNYSGTCSLGLIDSAFLATYSFNFSLNFRSCYASWTWSRLTKVVVECLIIEVLVFKILSLIRRFDVASDSSFYRLLYRVECNSLGRLLSTDD